MLERKKTRFFLSLTCGGPRSYKQNYLILGVWITFIKSEKSFQNIRRNSGMGVDNSGDNFVDNLCKTISNLILDK